jgi:hypothetical protein
MSPLLFAALAFAVMAPAPRTRSDGPSLKEVVRRMAAYVEAYGDKASIVVATERYTQHASSSRPSSATALDHRVTVADFAIVKAEGFGGWVGIRDIVEVDGARITDREDRLIQLLTASSGSMDEARRLSDESARFNIGPFLRNFNVPTTALFFFRTENLDRFKFTRKSVGGDGTWEIAFRETTRPALIRTPDGASVPTEGTMWVDAASGTVVRTRLRMAAFGAPGASPGTTSAEIAVTYRRVPALDMWLPDSMTESYEVVHGLVWERTTADAGYTDYRQFQTSVRIK